MLIARLLASEFSLVLCADQLGTKMEIRYLIFGNNMLRDLLLICCLDCLSSSIKSGYQKATGLNCVPSAHVETHSLNYDFISLWLLL